MQEAPEEDQLEKVWEAQDKWLKEHFPDQKFLNQGWFIDDVEGVVGTKVYGHGVLLTDMETLEHEFETFEERYGPQRNR